MRFGLRSHRQACSFCELPTCLTSYCRLPCVLSYQLCAQYSNLSAPSPCQERSNTVASLHDIGFGMLDQELKQSFFTARVEYQSLP